MIRLLSAWLIVIIVALTAYVFVPAGSVLDLRIELWWMRNGFLPVAVFMLAIGLLVVACNPARRY